MQCKLEHYPDVGRYALVFTGFEGLFRAVTGYTHLVERELLRRIRESAELPKTSWWALGSDTRDKVTLTFSSRKFKAGGPTYKKYRQTDEFWTNLFVSSCDTVLEHIQKEELDRRYARADDCVSAYNMLLAQVKAATRFDQRFAALAAEFEAEWRTQLAQGSSPSVQFLFGSPIQVRGNLTKLVREFLTSISPSVSVSLPVVDKEDALAWLEAREEQNDAQR